MTEHLKYQAYLLVHSFFYGTPIKDWITQENYTNVFNDDWNALMDIIAKINTFPEASKTPEYQLISESLILADIQSTYAHVVLFITKQHNPKSNTKLFKESLVTDLFEFYLKLPDKVQDAINSFDNSKDPYKECELLLENLESLGYTFEYGLSGEPFNLRKL